MPFISFFHIRRCDLGDVHYLYGSIMLFLRAVNRLPYK
tara:strand:+ start:6282 stop:6395 length:114 start_codon:yes stop_codon:yes gene_type:complete